MSINFTARFLTNATITKRITDGVYLPTQVSIVELDKNDSGDMDAVFDASNMWKKNGGLYAQKIFTEMGKLYEYADTKQERFIALTEQNADYDKLKPQYILGLTDLLTDNYDQNEILWFETNPKIVFAKGEKPYKNVGKSLINYIKTQCREEGIYLKSADSAIGFYKKQGFKQTYDNENELKWDA